MNAMRTFLSAAALLATVWPQNIDALTIPAWENPRIAPLESFPSPLVDPFYLTPSNISSYSPGEIVRRRPVLTTITGASVESYQVFYRTTNQQDEASGTVATIWAPAIPSRPTKIFSWQVAEDSVGLACAPSWSWANSSSPLESNAQNQALIIPWALSQGYYIVSADFEGLDSAWLVGLIEGRGVLDGIRATANSLDDCDPDFEAVLFGYSGGAHATVWASSLAQTYAPELKVAGAAYGGTPIDLLDTYNFLNGGPFAALAAAAFIGSARGIPKANDTLFPLLTPHGKEVWTELQAPGFCVLANPTGFAGLNFSAGFTQDIFEIPFINRSVAEQSLLSNKSPLPIPVPKFPRLEWHGLNDTEIPVADEVEYVKQQCAQGADIRLGLFPGLNHVPNMINGLPGALQFLQQAFNRSLEAGVCGSNTTFPAIGSDAAVALLGLDSNFALASSFIQAVKEADAV